MSDGSSDVTKALAAFGAPAIRYHSFGQTPIRPSSVVQARRAPAPEPGPVVHMEPTAAPEPVAALRRPSVLAPLMQPRPTQPPLVAPALVAGSSMFSAASPAFADAIAVAAPPASPPREQTFRRSAFLPASPAVAPLPRPLAEWAAPAAADDAARSLPPLLRPEPAQLRNDPAQAAAPVVSPVLPALTRMQSPRPPPPVVSSLRDPAPIIQARVSRVRPAPGGPVAALSLPEVFQFLAAIPGAPGDEDVRPA